MLKVRAALAVELSVRVFQKSLSMTILSHVTCYMGEFSSTFSCDQGIICHLCRGGEFLTIYDLGGERGT